MKILGIDYGRNKIGLAIAEGKLAEPLEVIRYKDTKILVNRLERIVAENSVEKIVVGISEGKMGLESKKFSLSLSEGLGVPIETYDETLSTQEAQKLSIESGMKRSKRKSLEDAYAAAVILQDYLNLHP